MNLKKLELFGFKSFMRKLDIHFSDGITVIVGPNGCGKTNVTDAVRWVLGEGNARALRGTKMEDLIFNGTRDYKPLNVAEVELTVDNSSRILPIDFSEVTVTRRVYRSGESEFLINKVPGRLRDIHELFMDTGLGSRAYSVIERDMVEMVLADQPEKRRELIEEAAGIHKYKIRERQARRKLESTDEDLHRISDVLREVERQVRSLKRQVGAAKRFQEIRDRQRELEVGLALVELDEMETRGRQLREALSENSAERDGSAAKVAALETEIEGLRSRSAQADNELQDAQREVDRLADVARRAEAEVMVRRERREALLERARRLGAERDELEARIDEAGSTRGTLETERRGCGTRLEELEARLHEEEESLRRLDSDLGERRAELSRAREAVEASSQDVGRLRTELANLEARAAHLDEREAALSAEARELEQAVADGSAELEAAARKVEELRADRDGVEREQQQAAAARDDLDERREAARAEEARINVELESARSTLELLRGLQEGYEGYGQGARALLSRGDGVRPLADGVRPNRPDLMAALDTALEGVIEYLVAPGKDDVVGAVRSLRDGQGRATVVDLAGFRAGASTRGDVSFAAADPSVLGSARSFLDVDGDLGVVLDELLARTLIVETMDDALRLAARQDARGYRFVTRDGDWVEHPGLVHGGSPPSADDTRLLGRAARVTELSARVSEAEERRAAAGAEVARLGSEREQLSLRIEHLRSRGEETREALAGEERNAERVRTEVAARERRLAAVRAESGEVGTAREELARERRARIELVEQAEEERRGLEEGWRRREDEIVDSSAMRDQAKNACHDLKLEAERVRGEAERKELDLKRLEESVLDDREGIARREEERASTEEAAAGLAREIEAAQEEVAAHARELDAHKERRDKVAADRSQVIAGLREVEEQRNRWSRLRDESAELVHGNEMELQRIDSHHEELIGRTEREFEVDLAQPGSREAHGALLAVDSETLEAARTEREDLRRQVERLGAVNMVALDQYERESKRFEFLKMQKDDLEEAREKLRRTIRKINRTARTMLTSTLDEVRVHFQTTFGTLFEGGVSDIRLAGDEDPLHAPIEIFARPRGKRLNSISLMSSGERSLTAVAFLFAIYLVKPSPFCILDEVDAPLDDANIGRFLEMLKKVSRQTQFVMITHNKKTMEVADYLYGVTMQEPGVSQLVSVRLGREEGEMSAAEIEAALDAEAAAEAAANGDAQPEELVAEGTS
ncbi:MAG TPA: chromosome segregation protein SMC [bacterium]|nr:chromosome segregation protein SMC [bacterium]